jgi:predicted GIY-YIG superfamily endonuclease
MRFFVYVIGTNSSIHKTYVGWTNDVEKRLEAHNSSKELSQLGDMNGNFFIKKN